MRSETRAVGVVNLESVIVLAPLQTGHMALTSAVSNVVIMMSLFCNSRTGNSSKFTQTGGTSLRVTYVG